MKRFTSVAFRRYISSTPAASANHKTVGFNAAAKLVPLERKVCVVDNGVATKGVSLASLVVPKTHQIKILNVRPLPEGDPEVVVQVAEYSKDDQADKKKDKKKDKKPQIKTVQVSWGISESDLTRQKRGAIESILSRGHVVEVTIQSKKRREPPPNANQLESREKLASKLEAMLQELGSQRKPKVGTLTSSMTFFYGPAKE